MWRWEPHQCCKSRGVLQLHVSYFSYFFLFQCHWWLLLSYSNQRVELCKSFFMNGKAALININHHILVFFKFNRGHSNMRWFKMSHLFVCLFVSRVGSNICLTNQIQFAEFLGGTNETQGHWNGLYSCFPKPWTPSTLLRLGALARCHTYCVKKYKTNVPYQFWMSPKST